MADLPRSAARRTARLAALPVAYGGRKAVGLGKRLGGKPAETVMSEIQMRTAEQLFRTLGELKGGAMKLGQALSVLEAALPDELAGPYREQLTKLQDAAPPMPTAVVRDQLAAGLGRDWASRLTWLDGGPTAAASIGQVHRGTWVDGRDVAVKVQYPGAADALLSDLKALSRVARTIGPLVPGIEVKPLIEELQARAVEELDYRLEADAQRVFAAAYADDPDLAVPGVVEAAEKVLVTEWLDSPHSLAKVIADGTQEERDHYGALFARFLFTSPAITGMLHSDPHPGNFRVVPAADGGLGGLGVLDFGAVARLEGGWPSAMGRLLRVAADGDAEGLVAVLRQEGFIRDRITLDPQLVLTYLGPFVEPARTEEFQFSRTWMQQTFAALNDPRSPEFTVGMKLNLPPSYLLIHRTWLGGLGMLSQLGTRMPLRAMLMEALPGFAEG
ncbi:AarF/ABC1/UbiB kinase family protein [Nocardioides sp. TRM66260-LWL]|uniref:ABC1 kinase family protein n=1 Tax=Nocardioides sp. TRM66260-LWL TaxID=2874478 RepID=UPI001CC7892F|nr:AarF/ABC1/UbiB kinase family protein [Nocardioides sp. TRM66260-LWL]MBZ5736110.1 AarF/ABC1/UbiB kinase family protein [Nocardioides sp. TRM66260-LWL]